MHNLLEGSLWRKRVPVVEALVHIVGEFVQCRIGGLRLRGAGGGLHDVVEHVRVPVALGLVRALPQRLQRGLVALHDAREHLLVAGVREGGHVRGVHHDLVHDAADGVARAPEHLVLDGGGKHVLVAALDARHGHALHVVLHKGAEDPDRVGENGVAVVLVIHVDHRLVHINTRPLWRDDMLRRIQWYRNMHLSSSPSVLPRVPTRFLQSDAWKDQLHTLNRDYLRMPGIACSGVDAVRLTARFAAQVGAEGYTQGFLYLLQGLAWVFGNDEPMLYWSFVHLVRLTRPYGPLGKKMGSKHPLILHAMQFADQDMKLTHATLLQDMIVVRWCFIMFSQTFVQKCDLLAVWDLIIHDGTYIPCIAASILRLYRFPGEPDALARVIATLDLQIQSSDETAKVVATAMRIRNSLPKHVLPTAS